MAAAARAAKVTDRINITSYLYFDAILASISFFHFFVDRSKIRSTKYSMKNTDYYRIMFRNAYYLRPYFISNEKAKSYLHRQVPEGARWKYSIQRMKAEQVPANALKNSTQIQFLKNIVGNAQRLHPNKSDLRVTLGLTDQDGGCFFVQQETTDNSTVSIGSTYSSGWKAECVNTIQNGETVYEFVILYGRDAFDTEVIECVLRSGWQTAFASP